MKKPNFSDSSFLRKLRLTVLSAENIQKLRINIELDICPPIAPLLDPRQLLRSRGSKPHDWAKLIK